MPCIAFGKKNISEYLKRFGMTKSFTVEVSNGLLTIKSLNAQSKILGMLDRLLQFSDSYFFILIANRM